MDVVDVDVMKKVMMNRGPQAEKTKESPAADKNSAAKHPLNYLRSEASRNAFFTVQIQLQHTRYCVNS